MEIPKSFFPVNLNQKQQQNDSMFEPIERVQFPPELLAAKAMAAVAVERLPPLLSQAARSTSRVFSDVAEMMKSPLQLKDDSSFVAKKHLAFSPPSKVYSMNDIKLKDSPLSSFAVSEPFQLFTLEAVERMREEIFKPVVLENYKYSSNLAAAQLRGYAKKEAPFVYQAWENPEVLGIISKIAGVDLIPCTDFEIGHINLSNTSSAQESNAEVVNPEVEKPIVDWHTDSYPFVAVTMLSDCTDMIGGETLLRQGNGECLKVRGPEKGYTAILQGRYIQHKALRAIGSTERITSVVSFRPKDYTLPDDTVLTTVRPISDLDELYREYAEYRFEILQKRLEDQLLAVRNAKEFDTKAVKGFWKESERFLAHMNQQIVEKGLVKKGEIDDSHLRSGRAVLVES